MKKIKDLTKNKYGKLTPVKAIKNNNRTYWICKCDCGNERTSRADRLHEGKITSCGCKKRTVNGLSHTKTWFNWIYMKRRCYDKKSPYYKDYGGRGIFVCDEWKKDFLKFLYDMGERPSGKSLDRIDNEKGYYKENCRWATPKEQTFNRRPRI